MKPIHIFRSGTHTSAAGAELVFSGSDLRASAEAYDPAKYRAPIVVGHPQTDSPAYGYVSALRFEASEDGADLFAEPAQVEPQFADLARDGRFLAVSAAFYAPTAKCNPTPGVYALRHVGFLGATPPAIKGLKPVEFADDEDEVVEITFSDSERMTVAGIFRRLREFLLDKFDMATADQVVPSFAVEDLEVAARERPTDDAAPAAAFHEDEDMTQKTPDRVAELEQINEGLKQQIAQFHEAEAKRQRETARREHETFVDGLVADGKVTPAEKARIVAFMATLSTDAIEFADGEGATVSVSPLQSYRDQLKARAKVIEFGEVSGEQRGGGTPTEINRDQVADVANRAIAYRESQREKGVVLSTTQAVEAVKQGKDRAA